MFSDAKYLKNASSNAPNSSSSNIPPLSGQYQPIKSIINYSNSNISDLSSSNNSNSSNVKFSGLIVKEKIDDREKYLTAKYPNHQMALIKKRLKVEFWIDEQLKFLFNITVKYSGFWNWEKMIIIYILVSFIRTITQRKIMIFVQMIWLIIYLIWTQIVNGNFIFWYFIHFFIQIFKIKFFYLIFDF